MKLLLKFPRKLHTTRCTGLHFAQELHSMLTDKYYGLGILALPNLDSDLRRIWKVAAFHSVVILFAQSA
jgi:hypothetical protein